MRRAALPIFLLLISTQLLLGQSRYQQGTVTRMKMAECLPMHHVMATLSGSPVQGGEICPEYVLMSDKVVYVVVGKTAGQLIPLAERIAFRLEKNEIAVRIDDEKKESHFQIREMMLRSEWEHNEAIHREDVAAALSRRAAQMQPGSDYWQAAASAQQAISH